MRTLYTHTKLVLSVDFNMTSSVRKISLRTVEIESVNFE